MDGGSGTLLLWGERTTYEPAVGRMSMVDAAVTTEAVEFVVSVEDPSRSGWRLLFGERAEHFPV